MPAARGLLRAVVLRPQQLRQLSDVGGDAPCLVAGEQLGRRTSALLPLEIDPPVRWRLAGIEQPS